MPGRWVIALILAWLALGIVLTLVLRVFHHHSVSP
jgi:hypothetical protein